MYGAKIATIRNARGYTQRYIAEQLGMEQNEYSRIETDQKIKVGDDLLRRIAGALGVTVEDIKSPTPVVMNFHNSPYSGPYNQQSISIAPEIINALNAQLVQKDEQIARLLSLLERTESK